MLTSGLHGEDRYEGVHPGEHNGLDVSQGVNLRKTPAQMCAIRRGPELRFLEAISSH